MESHKKGQTVRSEARTMVRNVISKCDEEARKGQLLHPLYQSNARIAEYTNLSKRTITRIRKESSDFDKGTPLPSPGTKRPRSIDKKFHCTEEERSIVRNIIYDFYIEKKVVPSGPKLLVAIREKIYFPWKIHTLYRLLKSMGFKWRKSNNIRKVLIEQPNIVVWRGKYLKAIDHHRRENRNIVYIDETWVDNTLSFSKCWQSDDMPGVLQNTNSSYRLIIVHAGGKNGFVKGAELIFEASSTSGDYHGQLNADNFQRWVLEKLIPNISPNTVVIMDNAPYHSLQINKAPSKYAKKKEMIDWLLENNVPHSMNMGKYELSEIIQRHKTSEKIYKIDEILRLHGHSVLRLPPYMCELNPIELAWAHMKRKIHEKNPSSLSLHQLTMFTQEALNDIQPSDWEKFCKHTEDIEKKYWVKDNLLEEIIDDLTSNTETSHSERSSDYNSSSEDLSRNE